MERFRNLSTGAKVKGLAVAGSVIGLVLMAAPAWAVDPDPATVVGDAAATVKTNLLDVAVAVLPYAALLIAVFFGWRIARKLLKSTG